MNVQVENLPNCLATVHVEIPGEKVTEAFETVTKDYVRYAKLPGYRPGKAPRGIVESKFKKDIRTEVEKKLLSDGCRDAIKEKNLKVLSVSNVEGIEIDEASKTMRFTATMVTAPEFELPEYKGIAVTKKPTEVTDAEIDQALDELRDRSASFNDLTGRPLAMEDFAVIDYTGTIDGQPLDQVAPKAGKPLAGNTDFWIRLTPEAFFPGFAQNLVGANVGESREFDIEVPAEFPVADLAGKKIHYAVTIKGLKEKVLPELNDEFAASLVPEKTLADIRDLVRKDLEQRKTSDSESDVRNQVMNQLLSKVECELPQDMVRQETRRILNEIVRENQMRGVNDDVLKESEKELIGVASQGARDRLKGTFILLRIAEAEKIETTNEEVGQRIAQMAMRYGMPMDKMIKDLKERDAIGSIAEEVLTAKTLDFVVASASVSTDSGTAS